MSFLQLILYLDSTARVDDLADLRGLFWASICCLMKKSLELYMEKKRLIDCNFVYRRYPAAKLLIPRVDVPTLPKMECNIHVYDTAVFTPGTLS